MQLWSAQLSTHSAVTLELELSGTFPMEVESQMIQPCHTKELEDSILEE